MLCLIEVGTLVLLLLLVVVPRRPPGPYSFDFHVSLEDVALLGCLRASALASTYACGSSNMNLRCSGLGEGGGGRLWEGVLNTTVDIRQLMQVHGCMRLGGGCAGGCAGGSVGECADERVVGGVQR
jgi:hypothetical protein